MGLWGVSNSFSRMSLRPHSEALAWHALACKDWYHRVRQAVQPPLRLCSPTLMQFIQACDVMWCHSCCQTGVKITRVLLCAQLTGRWGLTSRPQWWA